MDFYSKTVNQLIEELSRLPGIGAKSAQRLAFHIINMPKEQVEQLAQTIPLVIISNKEKTTTVDAINQDNTVVGKMMARHLLDLGHRRIPGSIRRRQSRRVRCHHAKGKRQLHAPGVGVGRVGIGHCDHSYHLLGCGGELHVVPHGHAVHKLENLLAADLHGKGARCRGPGGVGILDLHEGTAPHQGHKLGQETGGDPLPGGGEFHPPAQHVPDRFAGRHDSLFALVVSAHFQGFGPGHCDAADDNMVHINPPFDVPLA